MASQVVSLLVSAAISVTISLLSRPKGTDTVGPKLQNLKVTTSSYGAAIPFVYGAARLGGNMIWATDIDEVTIFKKSGGKGARTSTQTEYRYFGNFAMAFCKTNAGAGTVHQIFFDKRLVYDTTTTSTGFIKFAGAAIRVHMGGAGSVPDPLIEADKGVGNVPAHKDLVYVVFEGVPLMDFGNRIPMVEATISTNAEAVGALKEDTTQSTDGSTGSWLMPTTDWTDAKVMKTTRQLYGLHRLPTGPCSVWRIDMDDNDAEAALDVVGNPFPAPPAPFDPGVFSSDPTGGNLYAVQAEDAHGVYLHAVFPYVDGKVFTLGVSRRAAPVEGDDSQWSITRINPFTLRGISAAGSYSGNTRIGVVLPRSSISFTRAHLVGISNYIMLVHTTSPTLPATLHFYDRDLENMAGESLTLGDVDQIIPLASAIDREGIIWLIVNDSAATPGPNGETSILYKITVDRVSGSELGAVNLEVETFDMTNIGTGGGIFSARCMAYDPPSHSLVICGNSDGTNVRWVRWDIATQAVVVERIFDASTSPGNQRILSVENQGSWGQNNVSNGVLYATTQGAVQQADPAEKVLRIRAIDLTVEEVAVPNHFGDNTFGELRTMMDNTTNSVFFMPSATPLQGRVQRIKYDRSTPTPVPLEDVIESILTASGELTAADLDLTDAGILAQDLHGYVRGSRTTIRTNLEPLALPFIFDLVESDSKLKAVTRGGASARSIPQSDLLLSKTGNRDEFTIDRSQEFEMPMQLDLRYQDVDRDYQEGNQSQKRTVLPNPTQRAKGVSTVNIPIAMTADEARQTIERALYHAWVSRVAFEYGLGPKHLDLDPADVVDVTFEGVSYLLRPQKIEVGAGYASEHEAISEDPEQYVSDIVGDAGQQVIGQSFGPPGATELFLMDVPLLRDVDDGNQVGGGVYVAYGSYTDNWRAAMSENSLDGGALWEAFSVSRGSIPWGYLYEAVPPIALDTQPEATAAGTLARWPDQILRRDDVDTIRVSMVNDAADLASINLPDLYTVVANSNVMVIGNQEAAEVIKYQTVTDNLDGSVTLSTLLRGRRGTEEAAVAGHAAGERVAFLNEAAVGRTGIDLTRLAVNDRYRATSLGELSESAAIQDLTFESTGNRPYPVSRPGASPAWTGAARAGTVTVTWNRRTRVGGQQDVADAVGADDVPLSEATESYEAVLLDKTTGDEVVSTLQAVSGTDSDATGVGFDTTARTAAGYTDTEVFKVRIYQMSGVVGRGLPRDVTL